MVTCYDPTTHTCCGDGNACLNEDDTDKLTGVTKPAQTCRGLVSTEGSLKEGAVTSAYWENKADGWFTGKVTNGVVWNPVLPVLSGGAPSYFLKKGVQSAYCYDTPKDDAKIPCGPTAQTACDKDSYCSDDQYVTFYLI